MVSTLKIKDGLEGETNFQAWTKSVESVVKTPTDP
jgi:hypothetical protein